MSGFLFKNTSVSFANLTTQPAAPATTAPIKYVTPASTDLSKGVGTNLVQISNNIKLASELLTVKPSALEYNYFEIQSSYAKKIIANYDISSLAHAFPRFKPYENLTGLSTTRPEVIMAMTFKPLFSDEKRTDSISLQRGAVHDFTAEGELVDAQIQLFNLKFEAFAKLIADMKQNSEAKKLLLDNETQFIQHLDNLSSKINFLRSLVLTIENLKQFLNLRNRRSNIDFSKIVYTYFKNIVAGLSGEIVASFAANTDYFKVLQDCGFIENNAKNFSNTKLYLQATYELKKLMLGASDKMTGIDTSQKSRDTDPTTIVKSKISDINQDLSFINNISSTELTTMRGGNIKSLSAKIVSAFKSLDSFVQAASTDDRVALLYHIVSKEYSYSYALADQSFVRFLEQTFGYRASQTGNSQMFDAVIGHPGNRIIDRVYSLSQNAVMNVAQQDKSDFIVLPFEHDYIDYDSSVFSPGTSYYVDQSLTVGPGGLDLSKANELRLLAENQAKFQSTLLKHLVPRLQDTFNRDTVYGQTISNSKAFFDSCIGLFLDPSSKTLKPVFSNSNMGILFDKAQTDPYLKSLLFMYFHVRTLGIDNDDSFFLSARGVIEDLATEIGKRLRAGTVGSSKIATSALTKTSGGVSSKVVASIESELKDKSEFTNQFSAQLVAIFNTFRFSNCFNGETTKYSGMRASVLFLTVFEMMFSTFSNLNDKKAVSFTNAVISPTVELSSRSSNLFQLKSLASLKLSRVSFSDRVSSKLKQENDLVLKISLLNLNTFDSIQNAFRNAISTLQKADTVKSLNDVLTIVGSNENLSLLVNEPQINLVKNAVDDISSKFDSRVRQNYQKETDRLDVAATYMKSQLNDNVLFDDFLLSNEMKNVLYEYFSNQKYLVNRAFNSRILTVGIPQGFHRFLREKVALSKINQTTLNEKESDIIKVNVYKVDVRYQNLVFRPQTFLFELSRFVSKDYTTYSQVRAGSSENMIARAIPMRDYSIISDMAPSIDAKLIENSALFTSSEYDFLTDQQKNELIVNHVRSHMLELYVKLLTGFTVGELDFPLDDSSIKIGSMSKIIVNKLIDEHTLKVSVTPKIVGTPAFVTAVREATSTPLKHVTAKDTFTMKANVAPKVAQFYHAGTQTIVDSSKHRTIYSDTLEEAKRLLSPKIFDRVFNVFVDPDDFEIDQQETIRTESGKDMLESLFSSGKVIEIGQQSTVRASDINFNSRLKLIDKTPQENDAIFEKYFVTLETVLGDLI